MEYKPYRYKGWIKQANFDLEAAKVSFDNKFYEWTCFQSEQSAEKALKAVLAYKGIKPPKMHKLSILFKIAKRHCPELSSVTINIQTLQAYTFISRYPFIIPGDNLSPHDFINIKNGEECIKEATTVVSLICNILGCE